MPAGGAPAPASTPSLTARAHPQRQRHSRRPTHAPSTPQRLVWAGWGHGQRRSRTRRPASPSTPKRGGILSVVKTCAPRFQWPSGLGVPIHDQALPRTPRTCRSTARRSVAYGGASRRWRRARDPVGSPRQYTTIGGSMRSREPCAWPGDGPRTARSRSDRARAGFRPRSNYGVTIQTRERGY